MKTSLQWWETTLLNPETIVKWLLQQYQGEANASDRIQNFIFDKAPNNKQVTLLLISTQETRHSTWIRELLLSRDIDLSNLPPVTNRYWSAFSLPENYQQACAIASHAEGMRLERIKVIVNHPETPEDIRAVFKLILPEEEFHYSFFTHEAGECCLAQTALEHAKGLEALGLII